MTEEIEKLKEHASRCRLLAQTMRHQHVIHLLTSMADECDELAAGLQDEHEPRDDAA